MTKMEMITMVLEQTQKYIDEETRNGNMTREKSEYAWEQARILIDFFNKQ